MSIKEVKKKKEFLKIAQGLGIAIPASILLATNVDASPVNTVFNNSKVLDGKSIKVNKENAVVEHIMLKLKMVKMVIYLLTLLIIFHSVS